MGRDAKRVQSAFDGGSRDDRGTRDHERRSRGVAGILGAGQKWTKKIRRS